MRNSYKRNFELIELSIDKLVDIYTEYPADDAFCIPYIHDEDRISEDDLNQGDFYDSLICSILNGLDVKKYIGSNGHGSDFYSDYYDYEGILLNVLFEMVDEACYIEAIFISEKR